MKPAAVGKPEVHKLAVHVKEPWNVPSVPHVKVAPAGDQPCMQLTVQVSCVTLALQAVVSNVAPVGRPVLQGSHAQLGCWPLTGAKLPDAWQLKTCAVPEAPAAHFTLQVVPVTELAHSEVSNVASVGRPLAPPWVQGAGTQVGGVPVN